MTYSGQSVKRLDDHRLLTGQSTYVDDIKLPGMLHALVLRSPHAHATIKSIDTTAASSLTGVVSVVTAPDLAEAARNVPTRGNTDADDLKPPEHPVLVSGAERLPNGNTLITEGAPGRIFEVTLNKEIVWEYINPFRSNGGGGGGGNAANSVFRAHRYGPDHPGLRDRDLDPSRYANINRIYGSS